MRSVLRMWMVMAIGAALLLPVAAQQPAPPAYQQGMPPDMKGSTLAPHSPALTATPGNQIPLGKLKLPPGFKAELWAEGLPNARSLTVGSKGTVFVGTRLVDKVYAVVDHGDRREVKIIAKGLHRPNGVAFRNGSLYVAELSRILRYDDIEDRLDNPPQPVVVFDALPKDEPHGWKYMRLGPDGWLYFDIGAPCNICAPPYTHAQIVRLNPDTGLIETWAWGVRKSVGMDWNPATKELWFTENGRDWAGDDMPADKLNRAAKQGLNFGFPFCHQGDMPDPEFGRGRDCKAFTPPVLKLGPHVAALGMRFYTGNMFPPEYKNRILIAEHGSWNRVKKIGFDVVQVTLNPDGTAKEEPFMSGFLNGEEFWGRPADVQVMPDGALLVSDDWNGALYRISYKP
jgi:glucose/arabinose dehydrogenase